MRPKWPTLAPMLPDCATQPLSLHCDQRYNDTFKMSKSRSAGTIIKDHEPLSRLPPNSKSNHTRAWTSDQCGFAHPGCTDSSLSYSATLARSARLSRNHATCLASRGEAGPRSTAQKGTSRLPSGGSPSCMAPEARSRRSRVSAAAT